MKQAYETLNLKPQDDQVLLVTMNRPDVLNAMNTQLGLDLVNLFESIAMSPGLLRCIVLTGSGKGFCAGGDLKQRNGMSSQDWTAQHVVFERMARARFADGARLLDCRFKLAAQRSGQAGYRITGPSLSSRMR